MKNKTENNKALKSFSSAPGQEIWKKQNEARTKLFLVHLWVAAFLDSGYAKVWFELLKIKRKEINFAVKLRIPVFKQPLVIRLSNSVSRAFISLMLDFTAKGLFSFYRQGADECFLPPEVGRISATKVGLNILQISMRSVHILSSFALGRICLLSKLFLNKFLPKSFCHKECF